MVPDFFGVAGFVIHTGDNGGDNKYDDYDDTENSKKFFHFYSFWLNGLSAESGCPSLVKSGELSSRDIFRLLL